MTNATNTLSKNARTRLASLAAVGVFYPVAAISAAVCASAMLPGLAHAANPSSTAAAPVAIEAAQMTKTTAQADFQKRTYKIAGGITVEERGSSTFIVFSDDFKTRSGPDLKIFLSPKAVSGVTGQTATQGAIKLGELKSTRGKQEYELPAGVDINNFGSVLVHCEAFSKLWGGADLG